MKAILHLLFFSILFASNIIGIPTIPPHVNSLKFMQDNGFSINNIKLHLGCGENHLNGYINIDFPLSEHTLQSKSVADLYADISKLSFPQKSVSEVRNHHTFEHFNRQTALALVAAWAYWLSDNGTLLIETPDFGEAIKQLTDPSYTYVQKQVIMRHIFGSHEAYWATHYDGWSKEKYEHILPKLGFTITNIKQEQYMVLKNITIQAKKMNSLTPELLRRACHEILAESLVDKSPSEWNMHSIWCSEFDRVFQLLIIAD
jgi:predicted SAM-dependent methyltransferase